MKDLEDQKLVEMVQGGERLAFSELVFRHQKGLYQFLLRYIRNDDLAEDCVQEAFIKAYTKINTFEGRAAFKSWLFRIALNLAKNRLRKDKRMSYGLDNYQMGEAAKAESALVYEAVKKRIQEEIDHLPDRQKEAIHLRVFEDMPFKEIASIMDCPYDTAKANYRHGLMKLKEALQKEEAFRDWLSLIDQEIDILETHQGGVET